jgi:hypothetical protein
MLAVTPRPYMFCYAKPPVRASPCGRLPGDLLLLLPGSLRIGTAYRGRQDGDMPVLIPHH